MVPTARTAPLGWKPADLPWSWSREQDRLVKIKDDTYYWRYRLVKSFTILCYITLQYCQASALCLKTSHLDGLAPEGLMGVGVPEVDLSVLGAGDELLHGGMDVQTPQLICVTLKHRYLKHLRLPCAWVKIFVSTFHYKPNYVHLLHQKRAHSVCVYLYNRS